MSGSQGKNLEQRIIYLKSILIHIDTFKSEKNKGRPGLTFIGSYNPDNYILQWKIAEKENKDTLYGFFIHDHKNPAILF
jgi:hypothetical protein